MDQIVKTKVIGIDVGLSVTTVAVVDFRGNILGRDTFPTKDYPIISSYVEALSVRILALAEATGGYETLRSVGISAPSGNFMTGCIENSPNMPWKGVIPLAAMLRDSIGLAVALGNNAHITAMGERVFGLAHGFENFITVTFDHGGVGSCFYSGGLPHLGFGGFAGELGHTCMEDGGRLCGCGRHGCLEEYASERGVIKTAREMLESTDTPSMLRDAEELTLPFINDCGEQGDPLAQKVWQFTGTLLGIALANYASIVNPEAVVMVGELPRCKSLQAPMEAAFKANVFGNVRDKIKLMVSLIDDQERDVLGASALAWKVKEYSLFK